MMMNIDRWYAVDITTRHHYHHMALQPSSGPGLPLWGFVTFSNLFYRAAFLVQRPTPNLEDQASVFMIPGDRVAQLYPQGTGYPF
jgi:hypothetical protein